MLETIKMFFVMHFQATLYLLSRMFMSLASLNFWLLAYFECNIFVQDIIVSPTFNWSMSNVTSSEKHSSISNDFHAFFVIFHSSMTRIKNNH